MFLVGTDGRIRAVQSGLNGMEQMEYEVCLAAAERHPHLWCGPQGLTGKDVNSLEAAQGDSVWKNDWKRWIGWRIRRYSCMQKTREVLVGSGSRFSALSSLQRYKSRKCLGFFFALVFAFVCWYCDDGNVCASWNENLN
jgi:hypothetical protein